MQQLDRLTGDALDCSIRIHRELGPGLLESVYEAVLAGALSRAGHRVERQRPIDIEFEGEAFRAAFRADIVVNGRVLIEVKSVERLQPIHGKQLLTYLRLMDQPVGLLINFGGATLKEGFKRIVNNYG